MEHVIQLLRYDLSCHSEDFNEVKKNIKSALKQKRYEDAEAYQKEITKLSENIKQLKKAIKILTK